MLPPIIRLFITVQLVTALSCATDIAEVTWIEQTPYEALVKEGDPITINCIAKDGVNLTKVSLKDHQSPLLYWTEDGYVYDQQKIDISGKHKEISITIKDVQTEDQGVYFCWGVMMSEGRKKDVHGKGTVIRINHEVTWIEQTPYEKLVKKGDPIMIRCTAKDGVNLTKVSLYNHRSSLLNWSEDRYYYDQQKIDFSGTHKEFIITIKNVQTEDENLYYCWGVMMSEGRKKEVHGKGTLIRISYEASSDSHEILIEIIAAALCVLYCFKTLGTCT